MCGGRGELTPPSNLELFPDVLYCSFHKDVSLLLADHLPSPLSPHMQPVNIHQTVWTAHAHPAGIMRVSDAPPSFSTLPENFLIGCLACYTRVEAQGVQEFGPWALWEETGIE